MNMFETPESLRQPQVPYPRHLQGPNSEESYYEWFLEHRPETKAIYLPIFWWNNSYWQSQRNRTSDYRAVPEVQEFVDLHLDPDRTYYTVSNSGDGICEKLPANVTVFSAGGIGDIPIPLLADPHPNDGECKDLLTSFVGQLLPDKGPGLQARQGMVEAFKDDPLSIIEQGSQADNGALERFRELASRSMFGLAPRGFGLTSYRLYEMFDFGTVPVYIFNKPWLPYEDVIDWTQIAVLCWTDHIALLPSRLRAITRSQWHYMVARARQLHEEYFSREGRNRQIGRYAKELA